MKLDRKMDTHRKIFAQLVKQNLWDLGSAGQFWNSSDSDNNFNFQQIETGSWVQMLNECKSWVKFRIS